MTPREQLTAFAAVLWEPKDLIEVRPLPSHLGTRRWVEAASLPDMEAILKSYNSAGANLYAGVLPRVRDGAGTDADCLPGRVVWADFDHTDPQAATATAAKSGLPRPSMALNSEHGAHLYWKLTAPASPADLSVLVGDLAALLGSDPAVRNPSRIMRLPGFKNLKAPVAAAVLLHADPTAVYDFAVLRAVVPSAQPGPPLPAPQTAVLGNPGANGGDSLMERARRYAATVPGSTQGGRGNASYRLAAVLVNDFGLPAGDARSIMDGWDMAANSPPLGDKELAAIVNNAGKYAKKPAGNKVTSTLRRPPPRNEIKLPTGAASGFRAEFESECRGERRTLSLPWPRLQNESQLLRPGTLAVLGGPAGYGKSFFALELLAYVHNQGESWALLPLEDNRVAVERRLLAHLTGDWSVIADTPEDAEARQRLLDGHEARLADMIGNVAENPRLPIPGPDGKLVVPAVPYEAVLDFIGATPARVVVVDPLSQIDFGEKSWVGEKNFIQRAGGLLAGSGATLVIVAHTVKRGGAASKLALSGQDLQGAAELKRLAHVVLILDAHPPKEVFVWRAGGLREKVEHNRTVLIDKSRNGRGGGARLAFNMDVPHGPRFDELGIIAPKEAKPRKE